ncbi:uncharacterized protein LOC143420390 isoform X1 [Maylandia zebra]|uniref:uncharacterized protein LOC143420390 isoform X1 n=1 Tax=Maylandia zebra TaxID=106582 RepID=UPI00403C0599
MRMRRQSVRAAGLDLSGKKNSRTVTAKRITVFSTCWTLKLWILGLLEKRQRREGRPQLIQLESLTRRSRTLTQLFQVTLQTRLLASTRDDVNAKLESITGQLQLLVSEWEGFEAQREELVIWLADMDVRLSEVDQLTGNTSEKLKQLQVWACFDMTYI